MFSTPPTKDFEFESLKKNLFRLDKTLYLKAKKYKQDKKCKKKVANNLNLNTFCMLKDFLLVFKDSKKKKTNYNLSSF